MREASHPEAVQGARFKTSRILKPAPRVTLTGSAGGVGDAVVGSALETQIEEIERLSLDDLRIRWRNLLGRLAPAHVSRALLARILAYRVQAQAFGDLDHKTERALKRTPVLGGPNERGPADDGPSARSRRASEPLILRPGTLLSREWQGRMEAVMVVADGFAWNGEIFASLSAVAKAITGTKWNGHRFFGVRSEDRSIVGLKLIGGGALSEGSHIAPRASGASQ